MVLLLMYTVLLLCNHCVAFTGEDTSRPCTDGVGFEPAGSDSQAVTSVSYEEAVRRGPQWFYDNHIKTSTPVIIRFSSASQYKQIDWSDTTLASILGEELVRVEVSKNNLFGHYEESWDGTQMPFSDFLDVYKDEGKSGRYFYVSLDALPRGLQGFLPSLDFVPCWETSRSFFNVVSLWFGAGRQTSLLHADPDDNLLLQLEGFKKVWLFNPLTETQHLDEIRNISLAWTPLSAHNPDEAPAGHPARGVQVTLGPGDMLYIPFLWFHHVKSYCRNLAVSHFFDIRGLRKPRNKRSWLLNTRRSSDQIVRFMKTQAPQCLELKSPHLVSSTVNDPNSPFIVAAISFAVAFCGLLFLVLRFQPGPQQEGRPRAQKVD